MRRRSQGVTLLELIVCIAIIMLLAGLIFSAASRSVTKTGVTVSLSNLRQIHAAMRLYESDCGALPWWSVRAPGFLPYMGNKVLRSPAAPSDSIEFDYRMIGNPDIPFLMLPLDRQCLDKRGDEFVAAYDSNYARNEVAYTSHSRFFIVVRRSGTAFVKQAPDRVNMFIDLAGQPCPGASFWANF